MDVYIPYPHTMCCVRWLQFGRLHTVLSSVIFPFTRLYLKMEMEYLPELESDTIHTLFRPSGYNLVDSVLAGQRE